VEPISLRCGKPVRALKKEAICLSPISLVRNSKFAPWTCCPVSRLSAHSLPRLIDRDLILLLPLSTTKKGKLARHRGYSQRGTSWLSSTLLLSRPSLPSPVKPQLQAHTSDSTELLIKPSPPHHASTTNSL
jgi:hypothetical protein